MELGIVFSETTTKTSQLQTIQAFRVAAAWQHIFQLFATSVTIAI
jgi:hypothetical protein